MRNLLNFRLRTHLLLLLTIALLVGASESGPAGKTLAYFTSSVQNSANIISTVSLLIASGDGSTARASRAAALSVGENMIPGDYQLKPIDIVNGGTPGVSQQDYTYSVINTNAGDCSFLDSSPACGAANPPDTSATGGVALLLLRCTSDAAGAQLTPCTTSGVYATQVYPAAGASTQVQIPGGLDESAITGVASTAITVGGRSFTGGQILIGSAFKMGGPDSVAGTDGQTKGLLSGNTDHLAGIVYLPSSAGNTLANQKSSLSYTWTAQQRIGGTHP